MGGDGGAGDGGAVDANEVDPNEVEVTVDRPAGTITLVWTDGLSAVFNLVDVRLMCPCATCRMLREAGDDVWPRPGSPVPLAIDDADMHGAWGLSLTWNDGHRTGIYPFEAFRRWAESNGAGGQQLNN